MKTANDTAVAAVSALVVVIVCVLGIWLNSQVGVNENVSQYERGQYDGAHDLCQEVGGEWSLTDGGWCDMP